MIVGGGGGGGGAGGAEVVAALVGPGAALGPGDCGGGAADVPLG
jgi:hypothetical protein